MNRDYPGWEIEVYDGVETEDAEIEIDNVSCWNALVMINKKFGLNFFISKRNVKSAIQKSLWITPFITARITGCTK